MKAPKFTLPWVRQEIARHQAALADLAATERVMSAAIEETKGPAITAPGASTTLLSEAPVERPPTPLERPKTTFASNKALLLSVIADSPSGLTTQGVIAASAAAGLSDRNIGNTSPHLSGYGKKGLLTLKHGVWTITPKGREFLASTKS